MTLFPLTRYLVGQTASVYVYRDWGGRLLTLVWALLCLALGVVVTRGVLGFDSALVRLGWAAVTGVALVFLAVFLGI